jgi:stress response protein YsnF
VVGKRTVTESKSMSGDAKHEELEIDDSGIANGNAKSRF